MTVHGYGPIFRDAIRTVNWWRLMYAGRYFYPEKPFVNYITVRGFHVSQAATPWAPPTAEQIGAIGTHWSKGWTIEDNVVTHSKCVGHYF